MFKKIDILLIRSFIPPFIVAFFIAMFVLIMQFLWSFIDEIIGKGLSTFDLLELLMYRSFTLIPLALPIGVLLSSVMVFGNLSEKYELSALKSAGVSLLRIMAPVIFCGMVISAFSLYSSNTLIPLSMLKFQSRLWDIRNQKPALSLEEGIFNDDFDNFTIRIGNKAPDNRNISDVLIYDHSTSTRRKFNMLMATSGEMYISDDQRDFVMKLYDGYQYREVEQQGLDRGSAFARTHFKEWTKYFSLDEFELGQTDESLFESHQMMKSMGQLAEEIDTIELEYHKYALKGLHDYNGILNNKKEVEHLLEEPRQDTLEERGLVSLESAGQATAKSDQGTDISKLEKAPRTVKYRAPLLKVLDTLPAQTDWNTVFGAFEKKTRVQYTTSAISRVKSFRDNSRRVKARLAVIDLQRIGHVYELHSKMSIAAICIIFLFIGAPMGAIVRKGGYGYPLLVSIAFFTAFIVLTIMFDKLADTKAVDPILAAWAPCLIILPISAFLTYKALNDSKLLSAGRWINKLYAYAAARQEQRAKAGPGLTGDS